MDNTFEINKIVNYLKQYKNQLPELYTWNPKIEKLIALNVITSKDILVLNGLSFYEKEILLKQKLHVKLNVYFESDKELFYKLCLWIIKDWGGILGAKDTDTLTVIDNFLNSESPSFKRIASTSKVGAFMFPEKYIIYDSRVAYALNWIILSENTGSHFFPIPNGRNSKMMAFDMNVLIRLKHLENYCPESLEDMDERQYVKRRDKTLFIPEKEAYLELNKLIRAISAELWEGEQAKMLYYTEMLLFSIADREIFDDITKRIKLNIT
ncbi:hypothetical protein [Cellulophaga sp. L1A9]|uniref:hypothetical protein n=1 Tax=Cellulophaga sp. L1A9 TaxID=2686362 RepID=UPI00131BCC4A|nr:hypothetical protein [Cellulophaga sp. L1A9]